ncbi:MAG TPA: hypothetical protein VF988_10645, partial [Verrucomicrobiae bacterium]
MNEKANNTAAELLDQGIKNYEQAIRTGLKYQEEAGKSCVRFMNQLTAPQDLQKQFAAFTSDVIPATRKAMDEWADLAEQNHRTCMDLAKKGVEVTQTGSYAESQAKISDFCEASIKSIKANAQAVVDIGNQTMDSWLAYWEKATA